MPTAAMTRKKGNKKMSLNLPFIHFEYTCIYFVLRERVGSLLHNFYPPVFCLAFFSALRIYFQFIKVLFVAASC